MQTSTLLLLGGIAYLWYKHSQNTSGITPLDVLCQDASGTVFNITPGTSCPAGTLQPTISVITTHDPIYLGAPVYIGK